MYTLLAVYVCDRANKLCEYLLRSFDRKMAFIAEVVVQFIALAIFQNKPYLMLGHNDFVEAGDMWMYKLAMVMDLASEVRVVLARGLEDNLCAIGKVMPC